MNQLVRELIRPLLEQGGVTALYGGGFKPPTKGHFDLVKKALDNHPEIDKFIIYVGGGTRDGIRQEQALEIWDIYKDLLGDKVEIIPSSAPIGDIVRYARDNSDEKVYFIIGAREGRDDDMEDVATRTKGIEDKYPNTSVKLITTPNAGMSGTNARKAIGDATEFIKYLPSELQPSEKEKVYNIVSKSLLKEGVIFENEELDNLQLYSPSEIRSMDLPKEGGIYFWWVNSEAAAVIDGLSPNTQIGMCQKRNVNGEEYSLVYVGLAKNLSSRVKDWHINQKHSDSAVRSGFISTLRHTIAAILGQNLYAQEAVNDFQNKYMLVGFIETEDYKAEELKFIGSCSLPLNIRDNKTHPFYKELKALRKISKQQPINEHSMGSSIDLLPYLAKLTQHMIKKGYNINPLPSLEFIDDDITNAKNFLGKTAYYNPDTQAIVLYTHGRHPKDIARSYAHEMIHHIQNLEGRLGDITTTNTQEDDKLNDLEAEANLKGTMTFRNWTDGLEEDGQTTSDKNMDDYKKQNNPSGKVKDPFGLNQFARELMTEGAYDALTTKLTKLTINKWVADFKKDPKRKQSFIDLDIEDVDGKGRDIEFNYVGQLKFDKKSDGYEVNGTSNSGEEEDKIPFIATLFTVNPKVLPQAWSQISADVSDVIRHELEHLTQSGENVRGAEYDEEGNMVKKGKYMEDDILIRDMINKLKLLPKSDYYKLEKEVDAMLQGLYLKAKKLKKPFADVINNYLDIAPGIETKEDKEAILNLWRSRRKALSLPLFEEEEVMNYTIYSDMDGVLSDFDKRFMEFSDGIPPGQYEQRRGKEEFWKLIDDTVGVPFWAGMDWMSDGKEYWNYIEKYNPIILSAPSKKEESKYGKRIWKKRNMPNNKMILVPAWKKKEYANPTSILIDDRADNINQWEAAGGIGILHTDAASTIAKLKKLGL
jgi:hypothetical protein